MQRPEENSTPRTRHLLLLPVLVCAAVVQARCDAIKEMIDDIVEAPRSARPAVPPAPTHPEIPEKSYAERAAQAIHDTITCLANTGSFEKVVCDTLDIRFTDESPTKERFDAAGEARKYTDAQCMQVTPNKKLRMKSGGTVRDMELIFWSEHFGNKAGVTGVKIVIKTVRGIKGQYYVYYKALPRAVINPDTFLTEISKVLNDSFRSGSIDFSYPSCKRAGNLSKDATP